jgi:hypothetical protein
MNELTLANRAADWHRLKALVLDSVSSPITKRVYNLGLDEFSAWYGQEPRPGFTKATVAAWRVALEARGLGSVSIQRPDHGGAEAGGRGGRQRPAGAGAGQWDHAREGCGVQGRAPRELAVAEAGTGAPERARYHDDEGAARPSHDARTVPAGLSDVAVFRSVKRGAEAPRICKRCAVYHCPSTFPAQAVYLPGSWDFRIRSTESIVFQLRVVAGASKSLSIWPR